MKLASSWVSSSASAGPPIPNRVCRLSRAPCDIVTLGRLESRSIVSGRTGIWKLHTNVRALREKENSPLATAFKGFPAEAGKFLSSLKRNNKREWFQPRKHLYEE